MPQLRTYIFESISDAQVQVVIKTYGTLIDAEKRLCHHVYYPEFFKIKH
jgi:hypothetical protein